MKPEPCVFSWGAQPAGQTCVVGVPAAGVVVGVLAELARSVNWVELMISSAVTASLPSPTTTSMFT